MDSDRNVANWTHGDNFVLSEKGRHVTVDGKIPVPLVNSLIQWTRTPLSARRPFFEVTLLTNLDRGQFMMVGTNPDYRSSPPAWNLSKSIRFRSLEGGIFTSGAGLRSDHPWGKKDDTVRVQLEKSFPNKSLLNFCLNGKLVYRQWVHIDPVYLYPAIGMDRGPAEFKVAWPGSDPIHCRPLRLHCMSSWIGFRHFSRDDDTDTLTLVKHDDKPRLGYNLQAPRPLDKDDSYFEVELLTRHDESTGPAIGLTPAWTSKYQLPGWKPDTIGYHVYQGSFYNDCRDSHTAQDKDSSCWSCTVGDRVGCGVIYDPAVGKNTVRQGQTVLVYFTRNGQLVYMKARLQPEGGFYPTVGVYQQGEKVKTTLSCEGPVLPTDLQDKLRHWVPVYRNFRFSEAISFCDFDVSNSTENIKMNGTEDVPRIIQHVNVTSNEPGDVYYFSVQVETMGEKSEIQLGTAPADIGLYEEPLERARVRRVCSYMPRKVEVNGAVYTNQYKQGDRIDCCVEQVTAGETWTRFVLNGRYIGTSETFHTPNTTIYPTICLCKGPISLKVLWADTQNAKMSFPVLSVFDITSWGRPTCVKLADRTLTLESVDDSDIVYNVVGPKPITQDDQFLVQIRHTASEGDASKFMFPGLGVTSGTCPFVRSGSMMLSDSTCILFFGTAQQLIIPGKGAKESEKKRKRQIEVRFQTIGCSLTINEDKCILQFFCDGEFEIGHEVDVPAGGVFPVICFQKGCEGHRFEVDVEQRSPFELKADVLNSSVPNIYDFGTTIYGWDRTVDVPIPVLADDIADITAEEMRPSGNITGDKISSINNIFISHCSIDSPRVEAVIGGLKLKGYSVQTTGWSTDLAREKQMQIDLSEVVLCCLSPAACTDKAQAAEIKHVCSKKIPVVPIIVDAIPWPPDGRLKRFAATFRKYNGLLLDFTDKDTTINELKLIEESLMKGVEMVTLQKKFSKKPSQEVKRAERNKHRNNSEEKRNKPGGSSVSCSLS